MFDAEKAFHRIRERRPSQRVAMRRATPDASLQRLIIRCEDVPSERILTPHAE